MFNSFLFHDKYQVRIYKCICFKEYVFTDSLTWCLVQLHWNQSSISNWFSKFFSFLLICHVGTYIYIHIYLYSCTIPIRNTYNNGERLRRKLNANSDDDNDDGGDELMRICTDGPMHITTQMDLARKKKRLTNKKKKPSGVSMRIFYFFLLSKATIWINVHSYLT